MSDHEHDHLRRCEVEAFKALHLEIPRQRAILRHLAVGCRVCVRRLGEGLQRRAQVADAESAYTEVVDRALANAQVQFKAVAAELKIGQELWAELREFPVGRRLMVIHSSTRHCTAYVLQAILEEYRWGGWREPSEGLELGQLAVAMVRRLGPANAEPWLLADLQAETLAVAGNAHSLAGFFEEAEALLREAATHARRGTGDPLVQGLVLGYQGSYELAQRQFWAAEKHLARAEQIYRRLGRPYLAARMLVQRGRAIGHLHPEQGVRLARRALAEMAGGIEPGLELEAVHQLAWCLCETGEVGEALKLLEQHAELYLRSGAMASFSRYWLLGRIYRLLQETEQAERYYGRAWEGFREMGSWLQLTMLTLDVAEIRVAVGDLDGAADSLSQTMALGQSWGLEGEGLYILHLLRQEVAGGSCKRVAFRRAAVALRRALP